VSPCPPGRDRGTVSIFTVIFALFVILLAGLLVDGGLAIHARQRAADIAEQGARAAADDIDLTDLRATGEPRIADGACAQARRLVAKYPEAGGAVGCAVSVDRRTATVQVTIEVELQLLSIVPGFGTFTMTSKASAQPEAGV
jgi:Flp pilus assembly protein TadG